jgi:hypothetical protein
LQAQGKEDCDSLSKQSNSQPFLSIPTVAFRHTQKGTQEWKQNSDSVFFPHCAALELREHFLVFNFTATLFNGLVRELNTLLENSALRGGNKR